MTVKDAMQALDNWNIIQIRHRDEVIQITPMYGEYSVLCIKDAEPEPKFLKTAIMSGAGVEHMITALLDYGATVYASMSPKIGG